MSDERAMRSHGCRVGFTLIELLVVVAIIVVLIAILIPALGRVRGTATKGAAMAQLNSIRMGLERYYADFSLYPPSTSPPGGAYSGAIMAGRGQAMLAQGLLGYLDYNRDGAGPSNPVPGDPAFGFRILKMGGTPTGKIYGPYVATEGGKSVSQNLKLNDTSFIDPWGKEILYYRSTRSLPGTSMDTVTKVFGTPTAQNDALFLQDDCSLSNVLGPLPQQALTSNPNPNSGEDKFFDALNVPRGPMGNRSISRTILGATTYILISAGEDGTYFTADDVIMSKQ